MPIRITTLLKKIDLLSNKDNAIVLMDFYDYMREKGSSENHIMNRLKVIIEYVNYLDDTKLYAVDKRDLIVPFLNVKINVSSLKDKAYAEKMLADGAEIERNAIAAEAEIMEIVNRKIKE